ncbi:MAG: hypothetical protein DLM71_09400 [Chloroflexi bacterium]|nr:MAG: hypothetical protein DLM71_09400 [Chloroflexota bacterium]
MFIPRTLARTAAPVQGGAARAGVVVAVIAAALTAILSISIAPGQVSLELNQVAQQDIRAPKSLSFISASETQAARDLAAKNVAPVYTQTEPLADVRRRQVDAYDALATAVKRVLDQRDAGVVAASQLGTALTQAAPQLSPAQIAQIRTMDVASWEQVTQAGRTVLDATMSAEVREDRLSDIRQQVRASITKQLSQQQRELAGDLAASQVQPNSQLDAAATQAARDQARSAVDPVVVQIRQGETVVRAGDPITQLALEKLDQLGLTRPRMELSTLIGNALVAVLIGVLLVAFLWRFAPAVWFRNRSLLLFLLALLVSAAAIRVAGDRSLWAFVVPTSATVLLIGILLDGYTGAAIAAALALISGVVNRDGLEPAVYVLVGGGAALLSVVRAERLNAFVRAGVFVSLANVTVVTAFSLLEQRDLAGVLQLAGASVVHAILAVFLAVGSFAMLGNLFGIMTVFQLLELANPSSRLLRRLLLETPGTYHHSVMVGNLAERAAETIGADPLLARVAAYYHDIGKMKNPLAFIENQAGSRNIHDELNAETSARIITSHIRDGIDLAYEHRLPVQIIGFIPQHHGTSTMGYFFGKAVRESGGVPQNVDGDRYRYPGPKPQSREAAILMLADGVEASVRSLDEKDEASIRSMVDRIVDARIDDGQLDDAELTLKNIAQIKEAFVQQLLGMYHSRIKYPDNVVPIDVGEPRRERA